MWLCSRVVDFDQGMQCIFWKALLVAYLTPYTHSPGCRSSRGTSLLMSNRCPFFRKYSRTSTHVPSLPSPCVLFLHTNTHYLKLCRNVPQPSSLSRLCLRCSWHPESNSHLCWLLLCWLISYALSFPDFSQLVLMSPFCTYSYPTIILLILWNVVEPLWGDVC